MFGVKLFELMCPFADRTRDFTLTEYPRPPIPGLLYLTSLLVLELIFHVLLRDYMGSTPTRTC